ncbi:MAG: CoA pyrophosphatase [Bacteroidota bacterium]
MEELLSKIQQSFSEGLPGWNAHQKMINYRRPKATDIEKVDPTARKSAVLALIYPKHDEAHIALMLRNTYNGTHSGQVSFPGGKQESDDNSLLETALREANEELNIQPGEVEILGALTQVYIPPSRFLVSPFLGFSEQRPNFSKDPYEVAELIEAPLRLILNDAEIKEKPLYLEIAKTEITVKYFDILGHTVWGATAMMLKEISELILD